MIAIMTGNEQHDKEVFGPMVRIMIRVYVILIM